MPSFLQQPFQFFLFLFYYFEATLVYNVLVVDASFGCEISGSLVQQRLSIDTCCAMLSCSILHRVLASDVVKQWDQHCSDLVLCPEPMA